ncbi:MAG TPA: nuclear transport factor 2 family protein [Burkholderiaceae bacterium]|nr:nuclear transport factor 2 family protein [Burkholderiaceae bacterium]
MDVTELIDRYCAVWSDPDASRRAALLAQVWGEGATYTDPTVHAAGGAELLAHIERVLGKRPGSKVMRTSALDVHHDVVRFAWKAVDAVGNTLRDGIDLVLLSSDGAKIARIVGFFGELQHFPPSPAWEG